MKNTLYNKKILVIGGTGMIGRATVKLLQKADANVSTVSLDSSAIEGINHTISDLRYFDNALKVTKNMDFVFCLAGIKSSVKITKEQPASFLVPMLQFGTNILEASRVNEVPHVLYTSSIGAYPTRDIFEEKDAYVETPMDEFPGWAKRLNEFQIQAYKIQYGLENFAIVRPSNVYGPGDNFDIETSMFVPSLIAKVARGDDPVCVWGDGSAIRDITYSKDIAEGIILAAQQGTRSEPVNLGSGKGYSIKEVVETLNKIVKFNYEFDTTKPAGYPIRILDISRAKEWLGYNPKTSLYDGLKETLAWYLTHKNFDKTRHNYFK